MVAAQEELDWHCLHLYGLTDEPLTVPDGTEPPPLQLGEQGVRDHPRPPGRCRRHRDRVVHPPPLDPHHSAAVPLGPTRSRDLVNRRIALIESDRNVGLVNGPNKRRWNRTPWEDLEATALATGCWTG